METYFICCLILLTSFVEVHSEKKFVHRGESVLLFANVAADSIDNEVHLYMNGVKNDTATWIFKNERFTMVPNPYFHLFMDAAMNIWIHNIDETYTGKYTLYNSSRPPIELRILETKEVFRGETVLLFANVAADSPDNEVHLYINGVKDYTLIASWKFEKAGFFRTGSKTYGNIVMDVDRNIFIYNVDENYIGKYSLHNSLRPAIELIVLGNSQIKSERPSQNTALWIVSSALVIVASAFVFYVANTQKLGMRIRTCYQRRNGTPLTRYGSEEKLIELVSSETPQYAEELNENLRPLKASDTVIQEQAKTEMVGRNLRNLVNHVQSSPFTWGTLSEALDNSTHDLYMTDNVRGTLSEALDNSTHDLYMTDNVRPPCEDYSDWLNRNMTFESD